MQYLTVGTSEIKKELFRNVEDTDSGSLKPRGGLWLTKYDSKYKNYNEWVDFILENPTVFFYKNTGTSIWEQPCSLVTLKDSTNVFYLGNEEKLDYLRREYPIDDKKFSYQAISHIYDGIFVDIYSLMRNIHDNDISSKLLKFGVNSLILFNLDCIDYYQSGTVLIEPFDYEYGTYEAPMYEINLDNVKKRILSKK